MGSSKAQKKQAPERRRRTKTRNDRSRADYAFDPTARDSGVRTGSVSVRDVKTTRVSAPLSAELVKTAKESGRR